MAEIKKEKIWYVAFPTYQYIEDVKALARQAGVKVIDAKFQGDKPQCENPPKLTKKTAKELEKSADDL